MLGFIGYGHMGSVMLRSLLLTKTIEPKHVVVSTRTMNKLDELKGIYPDIGIAYDNREAASKSSMLFLCVGTSQVKPVLTEINNALNPSTHLIIISGGLEIASVERVFDGPISKAIPTIIAEVQAGVTLLSHSAKVSSTAKAYLSELFSKIGKVRVIGEHQFEIAADFTSCAPGLFASICEQFVRSGIKQGNFTYEDAAEMLLQTIYGTAKLLLHSHEDFSTLTRRVATKGGATEGGVSVLEEKLPNVFDHMFAATIERHEVRKLLTRQQFDEITQT